MDLFFIGGLFPEHLESEIVRNSRGTIQFAANNFQWALIEGIDTIHTPGIQICNVLLIGSYPFGYKKLIIRKESFSHKPGVNDTNHGFVNLFGLNMIARFLAGMNGIFKWAIKKSSQRVILNYSIHTPFLLASYINKLFFPQIKLCLIVPDIPALMSDSKNIIYRALKEVDSMIIKFCIRKVDAFVLLNESMLSQLNIGTKPWIRVEGIFNIKKYTYVQAKNHLKTIMYSGNLDKSQGIMELIEAFSMISDKSFTLWITGSGNALKYIIEAARKDQRIVYWPKLELKELFILMQKATLLINPIRNNHPKTKFFFPSKIIEYMASGTPTLMYNLECLPKEYEQYLLFFFDNTIKGMHDRIIEICNKQEHELVKIGSDAKDFILRYKSSEIQGARIFSMLKGLF